jgi:hypothetical protein
LLLRGCCVTYQHLFHESHLPLQLVWSFHGCCDGILLHLLATLMSTSCCSCFLSWSTYSPFLFLLLLFPLLVEFLSRTNPIFLFSRNYLLPFSQFFSPPLPVALWFLFTTLRAPSPPLSTTLKFNFCHSI